MDKMRPGQTGKRPAKVKGHATPFDLIPLGSKPREGESSGSKLIAAATKRETQSPVNTNLLAKVPKYGSPRPESPAHKYDEIAIECSSSELLDRLQSGNCDSQTSDRLLCGAVKQLKSHRSKPNNNLILALLYLSKDQPSLFITENVTGALCSLLKRDLSSNFKAKGNPTLSVVACNILYTVFCKEEQWIQNFVEIYLDDSLGERLWVDRPDCKPFVDNVVSVFGTNLTPKNPIVFENVAQTLAVNPSGSSSSPSHSPFHPSSSHTDKDINASSILSSLSSNAIVKNRYKFHHESLEKMLMETVTEQIAKRQHTELGNKQVLKLMTSAAGFSAVRLLAVNKLEIWLQNPKLMRVAQELLLGVCLNCSGKDPSDKDVIVGLLKMRFKNKQLISHYLACIRELLENGKENLNITLTHTIYNELSANKNQNNMQILSAMFQFDPDLSAKLLAGVFMDLLMNKEDYLRALRGLLREIVKTIRQDFAFQTFCASLLEDRSGHPGFSSLEYAVKERFMLAITDLVALCELLTISPAVREAASSSSWNNKRRDVAAMHMFWTQIAHIQRSAVMWMSESFIPMIADSDSQHFVHCLHKLLMMAPAELYHKADNWPTEQERGVMLQLVSEAPVLEDTLIQVMIMGMGNDHPLKPSDALDIIDLMTNRAASLNASNYPALDIRNMDIIHLLLKISTYHHPDNIKLPRGYEPPHLAISTMYWKAWLLILTISAYNPATIAKHIWREYPTLETLMEMVMTNTYSFPPVTVGNEIESIFARERQLCELEKQEILEFEGHLAAATSNVTITEANSLLLSQLISMNARGPARQPPQKILDDIKALNMSLHLGQLLSKSRNPDFLMQIIQKQGTSNAMPWLLELVESNEGSLEILPVQCLCEFLLVGNEDKSNDGKLKQTQKLTKHDKLLQRLQLIVNQSTTSSDQMAATEILEFFFKRLYSPSADTRQLAMKALRVMFSRQTSLENDAETRRDTEKFDWLMDIPQLRMFNVVKDLIQDSLHKALQFELETDVVAAYLGYLLQSSAYSLEPSPTILVLSIILIQRPSICKTLFAKNSAFSEIVTAYYSFTQDAISRPSSFDWSDKDNIVMVQWNENKIAELDIRIVQAIILIICYPSLSDFKNGKALLQCWFPENGEMPVGYMSNSSELAELLTEKLKLSMLQTGQAVLVNAALHEATFSEVLRFFQSYGLPVSTVDSILERIDKSCATDLVMVKRMIQSQEAYFNMLLEAHRLRGAKSGNHFSSILGSASQKMDESHIQNEKKDVKSSQGHQKPQISVSLNTVADDLVGFVNNVLLDVSMCREGFITAQRLCSARADVQNDLAACFVTVINDRNKDRFLRVAAREGYLLAGLLRILLTHNESSNVRKLFECLCSIPDLPKPVVSVVTSAQAKLGITSPTNTNEEANFCQKMLELCMNGEQSEAVQICIERAGLIRAEKLGKEHLGLIVDWLELLDPEINGLCSELQEKLLFGRLDDIPKTATSGPAYLRVQLAHQSRWSTIKKTICDLLVEKNLNLWDPTAVLDFLTTCINHPRIFQGRETKNTKVEASEKILLLDSHQLNGISQLVCQEGLKNGDQIPTSRIDLLISCCNDEDILKSLIHFIEQKCMQASNDSHMYRNLMVMLYTQKPKLIRWLGDVSVLYHNIQLALIGSCVLDAEIHSALTTLSNPKAGRKYHTVLTDANLVCRKLASHHPILFLRHLSTLSSMLSGRCQFAYAEFVSRNYLLLHTSALGLVELMQPYLYIHKDFPTIIDCYFNVIKIHGHENDDTMSALFIKFIGLLCNFFSCLPDLCVQTIVQYKEILSQLQNDVRYSKILGLKALVTASYIPRAQENMPKAFSLTGLVYQIPMEVGNFTHEQLKSTLRKLGKDASTDDIISTLNDLDATSKKVVEVLGKCLDEFKNLVFSLNPQVRDLTYKLIKRYAAHNPRAVHEFVTMVISCLEHHDTDISKTALSHISDLVLLMSDDDRKKVLDSAFYMAAVHSFDDGIKNIKEIVRLLSTNVFAQKT